MIPSGLAYTFEAAIANQTLCSISEASDIYESRPTLDFAVAAPDSGTALAAGTPGDSLLCCDQALTVITKTLPQKLWRMPIITAVVDTPGATGCPKLIA